MDSEDLHSASVSVVSDFATHPTAPAYRAGFDQDRDVYEMIHDFRESCQVLERQLEIFASSVRQLGSSLGLYKGARELQQQLSSVRHLLDDEAQIERLFNRTLNKTPQTPYYPAETWVHRDLERLVNAVGVFSQAWDDFPEFVTDNERRHCLVALEQHLLVWLNLLGPYEYSPEFLRCVRELLFDTNVELGNVTRRLCDFVETGVHEISYAQKHTTQILLNSATIATFFSAVTVSTIQYSFTDITSPLQIAVNTLWFSSLVLSVSSAINSLLAMTWRQAIYTPRRRVPWWVRIWFKPAPIILLSMSVLSFLAGLLCFVFLTQNRITKVVVSTLMAIVALGLGSISVWFAWERWDFSRLRRQLWLREAHEKFENTWGMFLYEYLVWRPLPTSLPTRSFPRPSISASVESPTSIDGSFGVQVLGLSRMGSGNSAVGYSDTVFSELGLQRVLTVGKNEDAVQHVRHVQFSSKGNWFAASTRSICYIYRVEPQMLLHQALMHPFGQIRQLAWSPDEAWFLIRVSGGVELWEVRQDKLKKRHKGWIGKAIKKIQWLSNSAFLVLTDESLIQFTIEDGGHLSRDQVLVFDTDVYTFAVVPPGDCVLVIAGHRSRTHEEIRFPRQPIRSVASYQLSTGKLVGSFPLLRDVRWMDVSSDGRVLLGFGNQAPPELWSFESGRISFKHCFSGVGKERFSGRPHFVGARDEFVACATSSGSIRIWRRDEGSLLNSLPAIATSDHDVDPRKPAAIPIMTWNPGNAMFASSAGAEVQLWAVQRGQLQQ
ncbi:WD40-repeat-containing domain protein [Roridomyces roridus]|uniref:WD40-repeat-containing domain protein n=1 Tax=Roridomyces roridus TaxID=1738132 RepID=A0AAD7G128_9AGAR|nr:WD40-repeat-containing domain protein [Roridomyces roridus]